MRTLRLVLFRERGWQFWEATWDGTLVEFASGAVGTDGNVTYMELASPEAAERYVEERAQEQRDAGYIDPPEKQATPRGAATVARNEEFEARLASAEATDEDYLVYADWLESNGDPRGQLISIQHALRREPKRADILEAQSRLFVTYTDHLVPAYGSGTIDVTWDRGFIAEATVKEVSVLRALFAHPSAALLRGFSVTAEASRKELADIVEEFGPLKTVQRIQFSTAGGSPRAGFWQALPALRHVTADAVPSTADTKAFESLIINKSITTKSLELLCEHRWPELRVLRLDLNGVYAKNREILDQVVSGASLPVLEELIVASARSVPTLVQWPLIKRIRVLRLTDGSLGDGQAFVEARDSLSHLEVLDLRRNWITPEECQHLHEVFGQVITEPQHSYDDDDYYDDDESYGYYDDDDDDWTPPEEQFSADIVPVYDRDEEDSENEEAEEGIGVDSTWERNVIGFDPDE